MKTKVDHHKNGIALKVSIISGITIDSVVERRPEMIDSSVPRRKCTCIPMSLLPLTTRCELCIEPSSPSSFSALERFSALPRQ